MVRLFLRFTNQALRQEGVWGALTIDDLGMVVAPRFKAGVGLTAGLDAVQERKGSLEPFPSSTAHRHTG
jgi:hypothetical protein